MAKNHKYLTGANLAYLEVRILKKYSLAIAQQAISIVIVYALTKYLSTALSERSFSLYTLYSLWITLPGLAFFGPLNAGVSRLVPVAFGKGESHYLLEFVKRSYFVGFVSFNFFGVAAALSCYLVGISDWVIPLLIAFPTAVLVSFNATMLSVQNALGNFVTASRLDTLERIVFSFILLSALWLIPESPEVLLLARLTASSLWFLTVTRHLFRAAKGTGICNVTSLSIKYRGRVLSYSWPFLYFGLLTWLQVASERWSLEILSTVESVADFAILYQIGAQSQSLLFGVFFYFLIPAVFRRASTMQDEHLKSSHQLNDQALIVSIIISILTCLTLYFFAEYAVVFFTSEKYLRSASYLPVIAVAGGLANVSQVYASRFMIQLRTDRIVFPRVVSSATGIVSSFVSAAYFGLLGVIVSTVCIEIFYLILLHMQWRKFCRKMENGISVARQLA